MPLLLALLLVLAGCERPEAAASEAPASAFGAGAATCPAATVVVDGACLAPEAAYVGVGGTAYYVDGGSLVADDAGPGTADRPWRTISRAARAGTLKPGDAVLIHAGVYREAVRPQSGGTGPDARVTFAAVPGETVVVSGADPADDGWRRLGDGAWERPWDGPPLPSYADEPVFRREMVVASGAVLRPVYRLGDVAPATFWADGPPESPGRLVARFPDAAAPEASGPIEVATRAVLFAPLGDDPYAECGDPGTPGWIRVAGVAFRHATNRAQWGAFCAGREGGLVEDVRVEWTNGEGIDVSGRGHVFRRTRADFNGQLGWGGACTGCLFEDGAAVGNNWKGHDPFWEAGGGKWVRTSDSVIRRHYAAYNAGPGIWLDIDNRDNTIEGSLVVGNEVAGIMLELRTVRTLVQHNVVAGTRWREWSGTGVLSQAASDNVYRHNTVTANEGTGLWLRLDPDRRAPDGGNVVEHNRIAGNATEANEAREIQIEATSLAHARTNRLGGNAYGVVAGDGVLRSTFFLGAASGGEYRGSDLAAWRRWMDGEAGSAVEPTPSPEAVGAALDRVRAHGDWRNAPRPVPGSERGRVGASR